jgi:methylated-DNA-[protein]-cysteine S-methyltransferase
MELLEQRDYQGLIDYAQTQRNIDSLLFGVLFNPDRDLAWRGIEALGLLMADRAETDLEGVREVIRRLFWQMNDESGGVIWLAPQAIGEILWRVPRLITEYGNMLLSNLRLSPFEQGVNWAAYRLATAAPQLIEDWRGFLDGSVVSRHPVIRAFSAAAYVKAGIVLSPEHLLHLEKDSQSVECYNSELGKVVDCSVGEIIKAAKRS